MRGRDVPGSRLISRRISALSAIASAIEPALARQLTVYLDSDERGLPTRAAALLELLLGTAAAAGVVIDAIGVVVDA